MTKSFVWNLNYISYVICDLNIQSNFFSKQTVNLAEEQDKFAGKSNKKLYSAELMELNIYNSGTLSNCFELVARRCEAKGGQRVMDQLIESMTTVFVDQSLALPRSAYKIVTFKRTSLYLTSMKLI